MRDDSDRAADAIRSYRAGPTALPAIIELTFPTLTDVYRQRLALEEKISTSPASITASERHALIVESFMLLAPKVESRYASTHVDRETGLSMLAVLIALVLASFVSKRLAPDDRPLVELIILLIGIVVIVWQFATSNARYLRRQIYPRLDALVRPLKPTPAEIQAVLAELKKLGYKIGTKIRAPDLIAAA